MSKKIKFSGMVTLVLDNVEIEVDDKFSKPEEIAEKYLKELLEQAEDEEKKNIVSISEDTDIQIDNASLVSRDIDVKVRAYDIVVEDEEGKTQKLKDDYEIDTRIYEYDDEEDTLEEALSYELEAAIPNDTTLKDFKYKVVSIEEL